MERSQSGVAGAPGLVPSIRVLVVEDDPGDADVLREMLAEEAPLRFDVECADRLAAGLERLKSDKPDVVLLDLGLPDSQGLATFSRLHAQAPGTPVVVLTGFDDETLAITAVRGGAQDYLVKGQVDGRLLSRIVRYAVERGRLLHIKDEFVTMVSHELRTPLSITKEGISLVLDQVPGNINERQERILRIAKENIDRLARIISNLLDVAKLEAGRIQLRREAVDVSTTVRDVIAAFQARAAEKGLALTLEVPTGPVYAYADRDKVAQILSNLIDNAMKFTASGSVQVAVGNQEDRVECRVSDTGPGIPPEDLPKVFVRFEQLGRQAGGGAKGTGLGLAIVKELVELHQGSIRLSSTSGVGTSFHVSLPKYDMDTVLGVHLREHGAGPHVEPGPAGTDGVCVGLVRLVRGAGGFGPERRQPVERLAAALREALQPDTVTVLPFYASGSILVIGRRQDAERLRGTVEQVIARHTDGHAAGEHEGGVARGYATCPDDGQSARQLLEKARRG